MEEIIQIVRMLGTWFLVIIGWLVVSDQQETRELAKNVCTRLGDLRNKLVEIENLATAHHTSSFVESDVKALLRAVGDFSTEMAYIQRLGFVGVGTSMEVIELRQAITAENMDESSYIQMSLDSSLVARIEESRRSLDRDLIAASHRALSRPRTLRESIGNSVRRRL